MIPDTLKILLVFGGLVALFAWSAWAGLAAIVLIALWIAWLVGSDVLKRRALKKRCRAQIDRAFAGHAVGLDAVFHSPLGVAAIGVATAGKKIVYATPEQSESYDAEAILEAGASKLPQGDFRIGISVPGRVSGRPYWQGLVVTRRQAVRWVETLEPHLGNKLKVDGLGWNPVRDKR